MSKMEKHLKQKHFKDHESFLKKKDEKKTKRVERIQKKQKRKEKMEEMNSEEGKRKRGEAKIKKIMKDDAKATINRFTGTGEMLWKHFHQMPNSEFLKCKHCHRFVIITFNSLTIGGYLTFMICIYMYLGFWKYFDPQRLIYIIFTLKSEKVTKGQILHIKWFFI